MFKILALLTFCFSALALTSTLEVKKIIKPGEFSDKYLLFASSGEVLELSANKPQAVKDAYFAMDNSVAVRMELGYSNKKSDNKRKTIKDLKLTTLISFETLNDEDEIYPTAVEGYDFTIAESSRDVKKMFRSLNTKMKKESQCYNRAHIWSYNLSEKYKRDEKINLGKIWIFFSDNYIKKYDFEWWFHVAPFMYTKDYDEQLEVNVMDRKYHRRPISPRKWSKMFMKNNANCADIQHYSGYLFNKAEADCYLIKSSMYYYQPYQIQALEEGGPQKTIFLEEELKLARDEAIESEELVETADEI